MDYTRFLNNVSSRRYMSSLRDIPRLYEIAPEGTVLMAGGMPNVSKFPFSKINIELKGSNEIVCLEGKMLDKSLQYMPSAGYSPLIKKLKDVQLDMHGLPNDFWEKNDLILTSGSLEAICKTFEMSLSPGDPVILQEPLYSGIRESVSSFNPRIIPAIQDELGVCPTKLRKLLEAEGKAEDIRKMLKGVPKLMYLNPTGSNPRGTTIPTERKRALYQLACEYDLIIMEDDPYYAIHFDSEEYPVSFLSMDTEGRVLRYDSFSKILSSGIRLGYLTGPKCLTERVNLHIQVIIDEVLNTWGIEKLYKHFSTLRQFYQRQRDAAVQAAEKHLKGLAQWSIPRGGMFLWLKLVDFPDTTNLLGKRGVKHGIILLPGNDFMTNNTAPCQYMRASFSVVTPALMDQGFARLASYLRSEIAIRKSNAAQNENVLK